MGDLADSVNGVACFPSAFNSLALCMVALAVFGSSHFLAVTQAVPLYQHAPHAICHINVLNVPARLCSLQVLGMLMFRPFCIRDTALTPGLKSLEAHVTGPAVDFLI